MNKKDINVCYFGDHLFSDVTATHFFNQLLQKQESPATWTAIAVIEEMTLVDKTLEQGHAANLIAPDAAFWGENYFCDTVKGKRVLSKFMNEA